MSISDNLEHPWSIDDDTRETVRIGAVMMADTALNSEDPKFASFQRFTIEQLTDLIEEALVENWEAKRKALGWDE